MLTRRYLLLLVPPAAAGVWLVGARIGTARAKAAFASRDREEASPLAAASAEPERPVDPEPQRILVVGDSMVYNLLPVLADYCLENGHYLHPAIWWGSTSMGWAGSPKLDQLIRRHQPTFVLVVLGSSEIISKNIDPLATAAVRKLKKRIGERKLAWIGPPNWREDTGINATLERELGSDHFFRSAELELDREDDGIHPSPEGGREWAKHFIRWWRDESAVPIRLRPPTKVAKVPSATCYGAAWETKKSDG
jgi:hypothetical protein